MSTTHRRSTEAINVTAELGILPFINSLSFSRQSMGGRKGSSGYVWCWCSLVLVKKRKKKEIMSCQVLSVSCFIFSFFPFSTSEKIVPFHIIFSFLFCCLRIVNCALETGPLVLLSTTRLVTAKKSSTDVEVEVFFWLSKKNAMLVFVLKVKCNENGSKGL